MGVQTEHTPLVEDEETMIAEPEHVTLDDDNYPSSTASINDVQQRAEALIVHEQKATVASSWANLTNTILGAGMLGIPFAFAQAGSILGSFLLLFCMMMAALGLHFLGEVSAELQKRDVFPATYFKASSQTYPWAKIIIDLAIFVKCFGVAAGYLIVCGQLMPKVVQNISSDAPDFLTTRYVWIALSLAVVVPLAFMKNIDNLRYASVIALFSTVYLVFLIFYYFFNDNEARYGNPNFTVPKGGVTQNFFPTDALRLVPNLPIFVFSFTCHQNLFSIYNELPNAKGRKINTVVGASTVSCFSVYILIGLFGYFTFGDTVSSNISEQYPDTALVTVGRVAIVINVLLSYALQAHPARNSIDAILFPKRQDAKTFIRYLGETIGIIILTYIVAFSVKSLGVVFSVVGATGSTTICYILPGFFYFKIFEHQGWTVRRVLALMMGVGGFLFMCTALTFIILSASGAIDVQIGG